MRVAALVGLVLALAPAAGASAPFRPAGFVPRVDNAWFPLRPGTVYTYRGVRDGKPSRDVVTVTREMRRIDGVRATTVRDRLFIEGRLEEKTTDWYAQDRAGNVWYLGEATEELDAKGHVTSREGSWLAGVDGAQPGISMPGSPVVGASGRQEYLKGHAEDHFRVEARDVSVSTPALESAHALLTKEWTPLEPGVLDHKLYVRGVGTVLEQTVRGGNERNELVSITRP